VEGCADGTKKVILDTADIGHLLEDWPTVVAKAADVT
jgi:hypothetical protein